MSSFQQNVIKHKIGLLNLAAELGNVSRACKVMGFSRDTFYRYQAAVEHVAETGAVLTEAQVQALEKKQDDDVLPTARSRPLILGISAAKTLLTSAPSRA